MARFRTFAITSSVKDTLIDTTQDNQSLPPIPEDEEGLQLNRLDWGALVLVALVLVLAPLSVGSFVNPFNSDMLSINDILGLPLVLILTALASILIVVREYLRPVAIGTLLAVRESAGTCDTSL
ncbi:MAG: hypothetical protein NT023_13790 [Armatimonadetes bacterium]|nr:hypothetical protein [Armatimonadota bacterium]